MTAIIRDPELEEELIARRRASGADRYDEVWEGVYMMAPLANDEHQGLVNDLCTVLTVAIAWPGLGLVRPGVNVSDREESWKDNFRCPVVVVFLNETTAVNHGTFWYGGPDFAIEIVSQGDQTFEKLPFYEKVRTGELLVIDRDPWRLVLYRLEDRRLIEIGQSQPTNSEALKSQVLPLTWRLTESDDTPSIVIEHADAKQSWTVSAANT